MEGIFFNDITIAKSPSVILSNIYFYVESPNSSWGYSERFMEKGISKEKSSELMA